MTKRELNEVKTVLELMSVHLTYMRSALGQSPNVAQLNALANLARDRTQLEELLNPPAFKQSAQDARTILQREGDDYAYLCQCDTGAEASRVLLALAGVGR